MMKDSAERYGSIARLLHWGMALLIGWQMLKFFDRIDDGEHWVGQTLVPWHISIGTLLLVLVILRIIWTSIQRTRPVKNPKMAIFVTIGHTLLYAAMVMMPVTGIMKMVGAGRGLNAFGLEIIPRTGNDIAWMIQLGDLHSSIAWVFLTLLLGHIGMALLHHFVLKDTTLKRIV